MTKINDQYVMKKPSHQNAIDLFEGEWSSDVPGSFVSGSTPLFNDSRLAMLAEAAGGLAGKKILELGPLEGAHTTIMSSMGAAHVTAIEANSHAYLKCLIVKEILALKNVNYLLGDFDLYLEE